MPRSYCLAIHVPFYVDGARTYATSEWHRALVLLRDSFRGRFDQFVVVAPQRPVGVDTNLVPVGEGGDGFDIRPSLPADGGKGAYWLRDRRRWLADVAAALEQAEVGHMGLSDLYKPINLDALRLSLRRAVTTVFVRDTDTVTQMRDLIATGQIRGGPDRRVYEWLYDRALRYAVRHADLSLLKGRALFDRYGPGGKNPKMFQNTSYSADEIVLLETVERRIATLDEPRPLRLVYAGRLVGRKGLDHAIGIVAGAVRQGADVTFDLIGEGEMRQALEKQAAEAGLARRVRFLGQRPYGSALMEELAGYDALFFTPLSEDTPRMIFDGYAAGLPLVGYDIPYVVERAEEEQAAVTIPFRDVEAGAAIVAGLDRDRKRLAALARTAHVAAHANTSEAWYRRRADWTLEAIGQRAKPRP